MLLVNQANDHGEITVSVSRLVAHDAKDRIDVGVDWNGGVDIDGGRLNSYAGSSAPISSTLAHRMLSWRR